jgi:hypothetical protein
MTVVTPFHLSLSLDWFCALRAKDIRGDSLVLVVLTLATAVYFTTFNAPLRRSEFDNAPQ